MMQVWQATLNGSSKCCNAQLFTVVAAPICSRNVRPDHFGYDLPHVSFLIHVILLAFLLREHLAITGSLLWITRRNHSWNGWIWFIVLWFLALSEEHQDVRMKGRSHLRLCPGHHSLSLAIGNMERERDVKRIDSKGSAHAREQMKQQQHVHLSQKSRMMPSGVLWLRRMKCSLMAATRL